VHSQSSIVAGESGDDDSNAIGYVRFPTFKITHFFKLGPEPERLAQLV
jgi:hypothetical protein